jgi:PIN domain nuclease of toxin-antitoxin system
VKLLLDTHTLLWYVAGDPHLSKAAVALIMDPANDVFMSPASYWEIAIKVSIGKLTLHRPYEDFIDLCANGYGFVILPIEPRHTARVAALPFPPNHRDPFDRLIVAQALVEGMSVVSADRKIDTYGITRLWQLTYIGVHIVEHGAS